MIIAYYYIGILIGIAVVLLCYFIARRASGVKRGSMCDKCKNLTWKDWAGGYRCRWRYKKFIFPPKYCSEYEERVDAND